MSSKNSSEKAYLVITAVGPDRPGIVSDLSRVIHAAGANLEDSRMAVLGGEFALLLLVSGSEAELSRVLADAQSQESTLGLRLMSKPTSGPRAARNVLPYTIRVTGLDRPGIVQSVTGVLAHHRVNVRSLESRVTYAAESGTPLFTFEAELEVPSAVVLAALRKELTTRADEDNLDLSLDARV
ncbi:MAG TPA: ACT domain-containing protein [Polyangiaceae bacterium]|nr:ACT domain-containing protein [Polyangiaceae bacterium]